jgi:hypothetical protein
MECPGETGIAYSQVAVLSWVSSVVLLFGLTSVSSGSHLVFLCLAQFGIVIPVGR